MSRRIESLCNLSMMSMAIATNLPPVFLTTFALVFGSSSPLGPEQLGLIGAFVFAGYMLGLIVCSPLANRYNPRVFLITGNALVAAGLGLTSVAAGYYMLLTCVLVIGIGAGIIELLATPVMSTLSADHKTVAMNRLHAFYSIGAVATIVFCSLFLWIDISWRFACAWLMVLPLFCVLGFAITPIPNLVSNDRRTRVRDLIKKPFYPIALVAIAICGASEFGAVTWLAAFAEKALGYPNWISGFVLAMFYVGMGAGRLSASFVAVKIGSLRILTIAAVTAIVFILIAVLSPAKSLALVSSAAIGLGVAALWPTVLGIIASAFPAGGASMFGIVASFGNFGGVIMPWFMGMAIDRYGMRTGFGADIAGPVLLLVFVYIMHTFIRKKAC